MSVSLLAYEDDAPLTLATNDINDYLIPHYLFALTTSHVRKARLLESSAVCWSLPHHLPD